jgi:hypothetical protein
MRNRLDFIDKNEKLIFKGGRCGKVSDRPEKNFLEETALQSCSTNSRY